MNRSPTTLSISTHKFYPKKIRKILNKKEKIDKPVFQGLDPNCANPRYRVIIAKDGETADEILEKIKY